MTPKSSVQVLRRRHELPAAVTPIGENVHEVHINYKRVLQKWKNEKGESITDYGGAIAVYPRRLGYKLDTNSLLPELA